MSGAPDRFLFFVAVERARHLKQLRFASFVAALIAVLIYRTQWLILRPGLMILLAGQAGAAAFLLWRNTALSKDLNRINVGAMAKEAIPVWFKKEEQFVKHLALLESVCQVIGFVALGYGFWMATRTVWLALAIGVVYPATVYLGMTRVKNLRAIKQLRTEKQEILFPGDYSQKS